MFDIFFIVMELSLVEKVPWDDDTCLLMMKILMVIFGNMNPGKKSLIMRDCDVVRKVTSRMKCNHFYRFFNDFFMRSRGLPVALLSGINVTNHPMLKIFIQNFCSFESRSKLCVEMMEITKRNRNDGKLTLERAIDLFTSINKFFRGIGVSEDDVEKLNSLDTYHRNLCMEKFESELKIKKSYPNFDEYMWDIE